MNFVQLFGGLSDEVTGVVALPESYDLTVGNICRRHLFYSYAPIGC